MKACHHFFSLANNNKKTLHQFPRKPHHWSFFPLCWGSLPKYKLLASKNVPWNFMPIKREKYSMCALHFTWTSLHMKAMTVEWTVRPWWKHCQWCFLLSIFATPMCCVGKGIERTTGESGLCAIRQQRGFTHQTLLHTWCSPNMPRLLIQISYQMLYFVWLLHLDSLEEAVVSSEKLFFFFCGISSKLEFELVCIYCSIQWV